MRRHRDAGNATALALMATLLISALAAGIASVSFGVNRVGAGLDSAVFAGYAAEAGLEDARVAISTSGYDTGAGNIWLDTNAIAFDAARETFPDLQNDIPVFPDVALGDGEARRDFRVDVWVYAMDEVGRRFRVVARAVAGDVKLRPGAANAWDVLGDVSVVLAQEIRARDTFARFATFVDRGTLRFGTTTVAGDVHSNNRIEFHYGDAKFLDRVTAVNGFSFENNANTGNTSFREQNPRVERIDLPSVTDVREFGQFASGVYDVRGTNAAYGGLDRPLDTRIELLGDEVRITVLEKGTDTVVADGVHDLPRDGVIYVDGDVTAIKGTMSGRLTISTPGRVNVTDNIRYVDARGNTAMRLEKNGEPVDPASVPPGTPWTEAEGYKYVPNPDFGPRGEDRPALGLMAGGQITLDGKGPDNLEVNAALFSASSNWTADLNESKGNLRMFGSITTSLPGQRAQGSAGYAGSGEYIYDTSLLDNPPPQWLPVNQTYPGPRWRIE